MAGAATFPSSRGRASPSVNSVDAVLLWSSRPRRDDGLLVPEEVTFSLLALEEVTFSLLAPEEVTVSPLVPEQAREVRFTGGKPFFLGLPDPSRL